MVQMQYSPTASGRRQDGAEGLAASLQAMLDAFGLPVAMLDKSGVVISANLAWLTSSPEGDDAGCPVGENYLDWSQGLHDDIVGVSLAKALGRVLSGSQKRYEQTFRSADGAGGVRIRLRRIDHPGPARFLLSHEVVEPAAGDLEDRVLIAQIEERERLASDLHDSVGQNLVCLSLGLGRLRQAAGEQPEVAAIVGEMTESLQQAHAEIRTLSFLLQPPWLDEPEAFGKAIRDLVAGFARRASLRASVEVEELPALSRGHQLSLFRILQEALVNIHRHAHADCAEVGLLRRGKHVILTIRDDGRGIGTLDGGVAPNPGVGILSMRARLRKFGGDLRIVSGPDGTTIVAKLPV
jgi:signal transduction histidine kinase